MALPIILDIPDVYTNDLGIVQIGCQPFCGNDGVNIIG